MGKLRGFLEFKRTEEKQLPPKQRVESFKEFTTKLDEEELKKQGGRCMDCGVPFCHSGCPLGNLIPDFNDAVYQNEWNKALDILQATNNFPEFTGRLCPAPCEAACVLGINNPPVAIELIEKNIVEKGFEEGWISAQIPANRTDKKIAIIGSGPAGLAAAQQLNSAGHAVTVYERDSKVGGLLRYGIPDFKLEKNVIDRRIEILEAEGITFKCNVEIGKDIQAETLEVDFDAVLLCTGSTIPRSLQIPGSDLNGVMPAMEFLVNNNKVVDGLAQMNEKYSAEGRDVIVIGGGDTGSDCIGTSKRQGAKSVRNFEITAKPSLTRTEDHPWPFWPFTFKETSSHEEGCEREWNILTKKYVGDGKGNLKGLLTVEVEQIVEEGKRPYFKEIEGSEKEWPCNIVLLAMGFTGPEKSLPEQFALPLNAKGNISTKKKYQTLKPNIFSAGDSRRGQSLIVWAISEGREAAYQVDTYLMGSSLLPHKNMSGDL
jgi:glutamate synthase (NADPH/NADH) small chain